MIDYFIAYYDYLLLMPYVVIFFLLARKFAKKHAQTDNEFYWLLINWWLKMVAGILYAWMIVYYYGYGDPIAYKVRSDELLQSIDKNWENIRYIFLPVDAFKDYLSHLGYSTFDLAYHSERNFMISRVCAIVASFTFNRYLIISFVFTNIAYYGFALLYTASKKIITGYNKELAIGILFIPSSLYWSSALAKEPLCMIGVGVMFSCLVKIFFQKKFSLITLFNLAFFGFILCIVKNYIFYCFVFSFICWILYNFITKLISKNILIKIGFVLISVMTIISIAYLFSNTLSAALRNTIGDIISINLNMYEVMSGAKEGGGSFINVGDLDVSSIGGIMSFIPQGLANVFFRPYPWEIANVLIGFTVLENLFFIFLLFRVFYKSRFFTQNLFINKNYHVFAIMFSISMAFAIAISTFNFGSMVRYKMPFLPFWATFLLIINKKLGNNKRTVNL